MEVLLTWQNVFVATNGTTWGNQLSITRSHISKRTSTTVKPNLRRVKALINGEPKRVTVCAKCLRAGKIKRAV